MMLLNVTLSTGNRNGFSVGRIYSKDTGDTSDEDDEDYDGGFDRKASKMENVTPDGGIKKKILHCSQRGAQRPPEVGWITVRFVKG